MHNIPDGCRKSETHWRRFPIADGLGKLTDPLPHMWPSIDAAVDVLAGGAGDDTLIIDADDNNLDIDGGEGFDTVVINDDRDVHFATAFSAVERVYGGRGNDSIIGDGGGNILYGGEGADVLFGEGGDDAIYADAEDVAAGSDLFLISSL